MLFVLLVASVSCAVNATAQSQAGQPVRSLTTISAKDAPAPAAKSAVNAADKKEVKKAPAATKKETKSATSTK